jgi:CheY-like chemotaxis protein
MPQVLALVDDLMFLSRIREAGSGAGVEVRSIRRPDQLAEGLRGGARLVLVDADSDRLPWAEALASVKAQGLQDSAPVVAFFSHVNEERGDQARAAGCRVLPRGAFVSELPGLLATAADPTPSMEDSKP